MTKAANLVALGLKNRVAVISVNGTHFLEYACIFWPFDCAIWCLCETFFLSINILSF